MSTSDYPRPAGFRRPTPFGQIYAYWRRATGNPREPFPEDDPQAGFYAVRFVKGGPRVPVRIFVERDIDDAGELAAPERLMAAVGTEPAQPAARIWRRLPRAISRDEYDALMRAQDDPRMRATHAGIDLSTTPMRPR